MRHEMPFKNRFYISIMKEIQAVTEYDTSFTSETAWFGVLLRLWRDGAFDEYPDEHFIIRAIEEDVEQFKDFFENHYIQVTAASAQYISLDSFPGNYVVNLENALCALASSFGYDNVRRFVTDQLSAGREQYDEEAFFEALQEIHLLNFFCQHGGMSAVASDPLEYDKDGRVNIAINPVGITSYKYEPHLNGKTNPEARFYYEDGTILDVEIKTPNFSDVVDTSKPCLIPGVLLDSIGRSELKDYCNENGIQCMLPNVSKMKDFINSAAKKFEDPENEKHINLLCVNQTGAAIDKDDITEPLIILSNDTNGILTDPNIAEKCQISLEAMNRVSAVMIYKMELGALLFSDFRYIFSNYKARVVYNRFSKHLNAEAIARITKLSCVYPDACNISYLVYANDTCHFDKIDEMEMAEKIIEKHILLQVYVIIVAVEIGTFHVGGRPHYNYLTKS